MPRANRAGTCVHCVLFFLPSWWMEGFRGLDRVGAAPLIGPNPEIATNLSPSRTSAHVETYRCSGWLCFGAHNFPAGVPSRGWRLRGHTNRLWAAGPKSLLSVKVALGAPWHRRAGWASLRPLKARVLDSHLPHGFFSMLFGGGIRIWVGAAAHENIPIVKPPPPGWLHGSRKSRQNL